MSAVKLESKLSPKEAVNQLIDLNKEGERAIQALLVEIQLIQEGKSKHDMIDIQKFEHQLFPTI
jgi:hypothetical protein